MISSYNITMPEGSSLKICEAVQKEYVTIYLVNDHSSDSPWNVSSSKRVHAMLWDAENEHAEHDEKDACIKAQRHVDDDDGGMEARDFISPLCQCWT